MDVPANHCSHRSGLFFPSCKLAFTSTSPPGLCSKAGLILSALTSRVAPRAGSRAAAECKTTEKSVAEPERDCDDCLYQNNWSTAQKITESIAVYTEQLQVSKEKAFALYEEHGTCLRGLLAEGILDEEGAEEYLREVHAIDYSDIAPDPHLVRLLSRLQRRPWIFTAATAEHAQRCLSRLGVPESQLAGIIDTRDCRLQTKHSRCSFEVAMETVGVQRPEHCILCDDSCQNVRAAKRLGWRVVLVGLRARLDGSAVKCEEADFHIGSILELPEVMPELFV